MPFFHRAPIRLLNSVFQVPKLRPQGPSAARQKGFQGFNADPQNLRRFYIAALLIVAQQDGGALPLRQIGEGRSICAASAAFCQAASGSGAGSATSAASSRLAGRAAAAGRSTCSASPGKARSRISPCPAPSARRGSRAEERILHRVFGLAAVGQHPARQREHLGQMTRHQRLRGRAVALAGADDKLGIRIVDSCRIFNSPPRTRMRRPGPQGSTRCGRFSVGQAPAGACEMLRAAPRVVAASARNRRPSRTSA